MLKKVSVFVGSIVGTVGSAFKMGPPQYELRHNEVVELYKSQILLLESELDYYKRDKERYEKLLFSHIGLTTIAAERNEQQQPIQRAMSPLRMKMQLENFSRKAALKEK